MATATQNQTTFQSSELSRNAPHVFAAAEAQPVTVTRRDGESLVLMTEREAQERQSLLEIAAQLIAVATDDRGTLADRMAEQFSWMYALDPVDRAQCADDLIKAARASFATNESHLVAMEFISWRESATATAAGFGSEPVEWLDHDEIVGRP